MIRRALLSSLAGSVLSVGGVRVWAKSSPIIAVLGSGAETAPSSQLQMALLEAGLADLGLRAGQDYRFETRWAGSDAGRFPALAKELLALGPAAIVVSTNLAALAVRDLSRSVPIVGTGLNAPVAAGLAASLGRPGGNVTGVSTMAEEVQAKLFEIMREMMPAARRLAAMTNPTNPSGPAMVELAAADAARGGLELDLHAVGAPTDLEVAFAAIARRPPDALLILTDNSLFALGDTIIARALALRVPTFGSFAAPFVKAGALFGYGRDAAEAFRGVARLLKRILAGAPVGELPFEQPTRFNFYINLRTAQTLGVAVPPLLLASATEVVE